MGRVSRRNLPHFSNLLSVLKKKDIKTLRKFFPLLRDYKSWFDTSDKKSYLDFSRWRTEILADLIDPLFIKIGINIKDEDDVPRHRKDNLICCTEFFLRKLRAGNDFEKTLKEFESCYQKIILRANKKAPPNFPFSWRYYKRQPVNENRLKERRDELKEKKLSIERVIADSGGSPIESRDWQRIYDELEEVENELWLQEYRKEGDLHLIEFDLDYLKTVRGKRGRHPDPFNVLCYHVINKLTRPKWRLEKGSRIELRKKDGQIKFERKWSLILFLLLDIHLHSPRLQKLEVFISENEKKPAAIALQILKKRLWDSYKNFQKKNKKNQDIDKTGFRKLIVKDDGNLGIITL